MPQSLARYHARSPRYILSTEDDCLIRVSGPQQIPWEESTEIRNVSLTGLAFTAHEDLCPTLGEVIRLQFVAPGSGQMACHAIVTRLEPLPYGQVLVAVHFYKVEMGHRIALAQGLSKKFREQLKRRRNALEERHPLRQAAGLITMASALWLWSILTYGLAAWGFEGLLLTFRLFLS